MKPGWRPARSRLRRHPELPWRKQDRTRPYCRESREDRDYRETAVHAGSFGGVTPGGLAAAFRSACNARIFW